MGPTVRDDLRAYYEEEAHRGTRTRAKGFRVGLRADFLDLLRAEGRRSVVDFGAGPGIVDGPAFGEAAVRYVGLDLAHHNARVAAAGGVTVVQGSIAEPPFAPAAFEAAWSMSTLMHLPEAEVPSAVSAMAASLVPGAPFLIGLWGGEGQEVIDEAIVGHRRLFELRSFEHNRRLLAPGGSIEWEETREAGTDGWHYQLFRLRAGA